MDVLKSILFCGISITIFIVSISEVLAGNYWVIPAIPLSFCFGVMWFVSIFKVKKLGEDIDL